MTRLSKTEPVPAATREIAWYRCDLCGAERVERAHWWNDTGWEHDEVTIESTGHTSYPGDSTVDGEAFDCCPACFRDKVRPALVGLGLKSRKVRVEF